MTNYAAHVSRKKTPQTVKASPKQRRNSAGGFSFAVDDWQRLDRFLILGSEGGTYYAGEGKLTRENAAVVERLLKSRGPDVVQRAVAVSVAGRAPSNDPAIFVLALASACTDETARKMAFASIPHVCRTGTHLFTYVAMVNELRGWGHGLKKAVKGWYDSKDQQQLMYQVTKYRQRGGWSHKDVLRLAHVKPTEATAPIYRWITSNTLGERVVRSRQGDRVYGEVGELPEYLQAFDELKSGTCSNKRVIALIDEYGFSHEMLPKHYLDKPEIWEALLHKMPITATIRNLGKLTSVGLLQPLSDSARVVSERVTNVENLRRGRVHPLSILTAARVYSMGHGVKGNLSWQPNQKVLASLDKAFHLAFAAVKPTGKRHFLALDVSGSMAAAVSGSAVLSCRDASAAMALVTANTESEWYCAGFTSNNGGYYGSHLTPLQLSPTDSLDVNIRRISGLPFGGTDCALPMQHALENKIPVDVFVVYTDSETYAGSTHPHQALRNYRNKMGINAKLVVVGMCSNGFSIADPDDSGMLDVVGFDTTTPAVIADFTRDTD